MSPVLVEVPSSARVGTSDSHQGVWSHSRWSFPSPLHSGPQTLRIQQSPPVVLTLTAVDSSNIPCSSGGESVQAFLCPKPPVPGPSIKAAVEDRENGEYKVVFHVVYSGECELSVLVNGGHIRGSPFTVRLNEVVLQNGHCLMTKSAMAFAAIKGSLQFPQQPGCLYGIAVSPLTGSVFVADNDNGVIHVFNVERQHVRTFSQRGTVEGHLNFTLVCMLNHLESPSFRCPIVLKYNINTYTDH